MYTNSMRSKVVMLGEDGFNDKTKEEAWNLADTLINRLGDFGVAWAQAKNEREAAPTPQEADKWDRVMAAIEQKEEKGMSSNTLLIGGGILAAGVLAFLALRN